MQHQEQTIRDLGDGAAILAGLAVFMQWLPAVAGLVTILYTLWRLVEALDERKRTRRFPFAPFGSDGKS